MYAGGLNDAIKFAQKKIGDEKAPVAIIQPSIGEQVRIILGDTSAAARLAVEVGKHVFLTHASASSSSDVSPVEVSVRDLDVK